ncbi:MAG: transcription termination/antitermination protein NusA [Flavobacteriales bacterium]|nr:transcription termination/antitermination protein NusA [Flavobacteriales bacterium]
MDSNELIKSFEEFKDQKNLDRITLMAILEESIQNVIRKRFGSDEQFDIIVNPDKGDLEIYLNRNIVDDEMSEDDLLDIEISEVRKIDPDYEVGEEYTQKIELKDLGRRSILALKQNLNAKIAEHDSNNLIAKFKKMVGEIVHGEIHHIRHHHVIVMDDEQNEMILPKDQQIPSDFFRKGESIKAVIHNVELRGNKPQIILSRTSPVFLEKLFEQEIPEVFDGIIMIKGVARNPGEKAKIAVESYDDRIDPVGACVGMKGSRIHSIVRELRNENIDVINYTNNTELFISRAMTPAKVSRVEVDEENRSAKVYLKKEELSRAIGKGGQNIRLVSTLTNYNIDVYSDEPLSEDVELSEFADEIDEWVIEEFRRIGLDTARSVLDKDIKDLVGLLDLEEETIVEVIRVLKEELDD